MSSKGRAAADHAPDPQGFYQTQPQVTRAILPYLGIQTGMRILEPGCGTGAIARVLREQWGSSIEIIGVEIDKKRAKKAEAAVLKKAPVSDQVVFNRVLHGDYFKHVTDFTSGAFGQIDLVITNPSFAIWLPVAEASFEISERVTLLLPWNAAASKARASWWAEHPAYRRLLSKRPSFVISVKCSMANGKRASAAGVKLCTYQVLLPLDGKPKKLCPICDQPTTTTRSDSNEYSWDNWSPEVRFNRWDPLETPDVEGAAP